MRREGSLSLGIVVRGFSPHHPDSSAGEMPGLGILGDRGMAERSDACFAVSVYEKFGSLSRATQNERRVVVSEHATRGTNKLSVPKLSVP